MTVLSSEFPLRCVRSSSLVSLLLCITLLFLFQLFPTLLHCFMFLSADFLHSFPCHISKSSSLFISSKFLMVNVSDPYSTTLHINVILGRSVLQDSRLVFLSVGLSSLRMPFLPIASLLLISLWHLFLYSLNLPFLFMPENVTVAFSLWLIAPVVRILYSH